MKKLFTLLAVMLLTAATSPVQALVEDLNPNHAVSVDPVSRFTVPTGKWYVMYNVGRKVYLYANGGHRSTTLVDCSSVKESAPYLYRLVETGVEGKFYIQNAEGYYFKDLVTWNAAPGVTTNISEAGKFTFEEINGNAGHWCIKGSTYIMDSNGTNMVAYGTTATLNGNSDWAIYEARILNPDELTGGALASFQLARGGLFRIQSRGNTNQYINEVATTRKASTRTKSTAENLRLAQMWIIEHNDDGFSLRNAQTGDYMQADYTCSTSKYFWKIQLSPNNSSDSDPYIIICHGDVGSYKRNCANLNGGSSGLTDWYYDNDRNSEWVLKPVESSEVDTATVRANLNSICNVGQLDLTAGAYYRFTNIDDNQVMGERMSDHRIVTSEAADEAWDQYWKVVKNDDDTYTLQNVFSGRYINRKASTPSSAAGGFYTTTNTGTTTHNWIIKESSYAWLSSYNIIEPLKPETGLATKDMQGVNADINSTAAQWTLQRVDLTEEQLQKAADAYNEYDLIYNTSTSVLNSRLQTFFSDYACTTLKEEYQSMSDDELVSAMKEQGLPLTISNIALKVKNDSWGHREKEFRIYAYGPYSDPFQWNATKLMATGYKYSPQSGPTGITVKQGDIILFFVDSNAPTSTTLTFSSNKDYTIDPTETTLKRGINVFVPNDDGFLFVHYTITNTNKKIADFEPITIHIEGGRVQGYFDITRGHTNADWKDFTANLFQDRIVHLKSKYYQYNMDYKELLKQITTAELDQVDTDGIAKGIEGTLHRWDQLVEVERGINGASQFEGRFNCILSASSSSDGNPYCTNYGTYYPGVGTIMNYTKMTHGAAYDNGANYWCIAHETGHHHQSPINIAGCTEITVNLFSQVATWMQGSNVGRYAPWSQVRDFFHKNTFWNEYELGQRSRMFFQLWLYFHLMEHDTTFYPRLFDMFRNSPIVQSNDASNPGSGTTDYLKFAKFCCDVAQADLSEFFQFWGFFVPIKNYDFNDYSHKYMTTTQAEIDAAIAYMQKYPKKLGNILFIDERIKEYPADYPGMPEGAVRLATTSGATPGKASEVGELGMFTDFVDGAPYRKYSCTYRAKTKEMLISSSSGKGAVGFKLYNANHQMIYASNTYTFTLPEDIINTEYYIVAALGDGSDLIIYDPRNLTAINDATVAEESNATFDPTKPAYDLSGRSVSKPQRGNIYLQNGLKIRY